MEPPFHKRTHFVFTLLLISLCNVSSQPLKCATPKSTEGECIPFHQCQELVDMRANSPLTTEILTYLRRSQCDYSELEMKVCCSISDKVQPFHLPKDHINRTQADLLPNRFKPDEGLPGIDQCGRQSFGNRIFNGEVTSIDEFPWMALLEYNRKNPIEGHGYACGGTLISSRYVLTAAHCVSNKNAAALGGLKRVRLGEHNIETEIDCDAVFPSDCAPPPLDFEVVKQVIHPDFDEDSMDQLHDIAILKLDKDVPFSDFVRPICLSSSLPAAVHEPGHAQFVAGWGQTSFKTFSPIKMKLKLPLVESKVCAKRYKPFGIRLGSRQICAGGEKDEDSCRGDSGGPLMVEARSKSVGALWYLTGVVSIGPTPCATHNIPGIYTRVHDYMDWILKSMKN